MFIGIHSIAFFKSQKTGIEKYAKRLVENMAMLPEVKEHRFILYTNTANYESRITNHENFKVKILKFPFLWTQIRLAAHFIFKKPDAFFVPAHVLPIISHPKNSIVMIHDIAYELFPEAYSKFHRNYLRFTTKYALKHAKKIIVPSENTKQDILRFYKTNPEKIFVIYHGIDNLQSPISHLPCLPAGRQSPISNLPCLPAGRQFPNFNSPYFLYVGRLELKKNILGILRAFDLFKAEHKSSHKLILIGKDGFGSDKIKDAVSRHRFRNDIIVMGWVDQDKKDSFLANADVFIFPSLYEGFGFPILEAQSLDVPVITSYISSMPEIAGEGAVLVEPHNIEEIKGAMIRIMSDENLRQNLIVKGRENLERFSWQKCARETLKIITSG